MTEVRQFADKHHACDDGAKWALQKAAAYAYAAYAADAADAYAAYAADAAAAAYAYADAYDAVADADADSDAAAERKIQADKVRDI